MTQELTIPVKGMHCASCAITIQKTLKKAKGVIECEVNYGNEKAKIEFDPTSTNIQELSKTIEPFGYSLKSDSAHNESIHQMHKGQPNQRVEHSLQHVVVTTHDEAQRLIG